MLLLEQKIQHIKTLLSASWKKGLAMFFRLHIQRKASQNTSSTIQVERRSEYRTIISRCIMSKRILI